MIDFRVDDRSLDAAAFLAFVDQVWPGSYDPERTRTALSRTLNITAYDGEKLVGCLRILTDGYYFGTITELLVLPAYQRQGIARRLLTHCLDDIREQGMVGAHLITAGEGVLPQFYEEFGFTKEKRVILMGREL